MSSSTFDDAVRAAEHAATGNLIDRVAQQVTSSATAAAVFGQAVEREGITVIPVAAVRFGFGSSPKGGDGGERGEGEGGGGGGMAAPVGLLYAHRGGQASFQRIVRPTDFIPVALGAATAFWIAMRALRALFR